MTTLTMIAGVALAAFSAGFLSGAWLWRWHMKKETPATRRPVVTPSPLFWDVHSLLNTMSRFAVASERGSPIDPALVYNLSDYLLQSSLLQKESGWADNQTLNNWLQAHLRIVAELKALGNPPRIDLKFSERIHRIEVHQLIRQMHWLVQRSDAVDSIEIRAIPHESDPVAIVTVILQGRLDDLDRAPKDDETPTWRQDMGKCSCELHTPCELQPIEEARDD